ncbi:MAG: class I SAM-dependent methyltransferase [Deltaproteobacteria bacterium]|nr:class I SAM-dependent methyltransferase [Deltaproteobacteria bacterium]MBW1746950.1 class I SAM-dependent methyltransferase [Deltaproteobacteria bacterium]MBW1825521.1 class I SAM-dependent methyltransferase [Deltaproteobacteria bacterium]MBW1969090.1 class I SAM-dependent methyltransferase [Deltaproteobacteria bacterium]MBW2156849.1 class I SAM-dependent methyltransferase [Deltaproteobacteria bacterium]
MKKEQVKFANPTSEYEELMVKLVPQYLEQHHIIYSLLPNEDKNYRVLDLGCGNGILSKLVFQKLPNSYIVGFDLTEGMLKEFEKKLSEHSGKFELKQGDFRTDSIGNEYDIIIASLTLHHLTWEEREKFYKTLYSSLNKGGLFIARDIIIDEDKDVANDQYIYWKKFIKSHGEDPDVRYSKHIEKDHPMTLTDHFAWLRKAGFSKAACQWRLYNFAITTAEKKKMLVQAGYRKY